MDAESNGRASSRRESSSTIQSDDGEEDEGSQVELTTFSSTRSKSGIDKHDSARNFINVSSRSTSRGGNLGREDDDEEEEEDDDEGNLMDSVSNNVAMLLNLQEYQGLFPKGEKELDTASLLMPPHLIDGRDHPDNDTSSKMDEYYGVGETKSLWCCIQDKWWCPFSSGIDLKYAILFPFSILMILCASLIIIVQYFYTQELTSSTIAFCNQSMRTTSADSLEFEFAALQDTITNRASIIVKVFESSYFTHPLIIVTALSNMIDATVTYFQNANGPFLSSVDRMLFVQLNSSVSTNASTAGINLIPRNNPTEQLFLQYLLTRDPEGIWGFRFSYVGSANYSSATMSPLSMCAVDFSGTTFTPCVNGSITDINQEALRVQQEIGKRNASASSVGAWTNLNYVVAAPGPTWAPDISETWGVAFSWPINYGCNNYTCFQGAITSTVLGSRIGSFSMDVLANMKTGLSDLGDDCELCSLYFTVAKMSWKEEGVDQSGMLAGGGYVNWTSAESTPIHASNSTFASNYTESPMVMAATELLLGNAQPNGTWADIFDTIVEKGPISYTYFFSRETMKFERPCDPSGWAPPSEWREYPPVDKDCVLIVAFMVESPYDKRFPVANNISWVSVLTYPIGVNLEESIKATILQYDEIHDEQERELDQHQSDLLLNSIGIGLVFVFMTIVLGYILASVLGTPIEKLEIVLTRLRALNFVPTNRESMWSRVKEVFAVQRALMAMYRGLVTFSKFVPATIVKDIIRRASARRINIRKRFVTTLFSDVAGFTTISEHLTVQDLLFLITTYLYDMTSIMEEYEAVVAEIQGDGLLAFWNTPDNVQDHPAKALSAALAQHAYLEILGNQFRKILGEDLFDEVIGKFKIRIGVHSGNVLTGIIGSESKLKFGCIGDAVGIASRLEGLCKIYGVPIICSEATYLRCGAQRSDFVFRELDRIFIQGATMEPTRIYEVVHQVRPIQSKFITRKPVHDKLDSKPLSEFYRHAFSLKSVKKVLTNIKSGANTIKEQAAAIPSGKGSSLKDSITHLRKSSATPSLFGTPDADIARETKTFLPTPELIQPDRVDRIKAYEKALHFFQAGNFGLASEVLYKEIPAPLDTAESYLQQRIDEAIEKHGTPQIKDPAIQWNGGINDVSLMKL